MVWNKNQGSSSQHLTAVHEYILVYAKNAKKAPALMKEKPSAKLMIDKAFELKSKNILYNEAQKIFKSWVKEQGEKGIISSGESPYKNLHPITFRPFSDTPSCAQDNPDKRCKKPIKHPITGKYCSVPSKGWKWKEDTLLRMAEHTNYIEGEGFVIAGQMVYGKDEKKKPRKLQYLDEKMSQIMPTMLNISYGGDKDLPAGITFSTPKPIALNKELIKSYPNKNITVLDYFSGSGSTAHAIHELNMEDNGDNG